MTHQRYAKHRFYVADIYANGTIVCEVPGGKVQLARDAFTFPAVGDVGTCYCIGTEMDGSETLAYEPDRKEWGRKARALTKAVAQARRRCDDAIQESDWQKLVESSMQMMNAAALLSSHMEEQP